MALNFGHKPNAGRLIGSKISLDKEYTRVDPSSSRFGVNIAPSDDWVVISHDFERKVLFIH